MGSISVITPIRSAVVGDRRRAIVDITMSASYATGGDTVNPAVLGMEGGMDSLQPIAVTTSGSITTAAVAVFDHITSKLLLFTTFPGTQATNASDQSAVKVRCEVYYKGTLGDPRTAT